MKIIELIPTFPSMLKVLVMMSPDSVKFQIFRLPSALAVNNKLLMICMWVMVRECWAPWA